MLKNKALKEQISTLAAELKSSQIQNNETELKTQFAGAICPNCGARLEGRKCKLFCPTRGCGYVVTCSEW